MNILIVGNGFDLSHYLPTKYDHFMVAMEVGDTALTTSGFYGVVVDKVDETTIIVEFGNDKHCRIPMEKSAIQAMEKANAQERGGDRAHSSPWPQAGDHHSRQERRPPQAPRSGAARTGWH